jgi:hypothetical protein
VEACTRLIDDPQKGEHNVIRRLPLILARAAHRIEAKDFSGAAADVGKARAEGASGQPDRQSLFRPVDGPVVRPAGKRGAAATG